jgi:hypothetical protein
MEGRLDDKHHWDDVYGKKAPDQVSWYRPHLERSLRFIEEEFFGEPATVHHERPERRP